MWGFFSRCGCWFTEVKTSARKNWMTELNSNMTWHEGIRIFGQIIFE